MFSNIQKSEIREVAREIVESKKWEDLPWEDALNGAYAIRPTVAEILEEARLLEAKAVRYLSGTPAEFVHADVWEYIRVLHLESAKSFSIYDRQCGSYKCRQYAPPGPDTKTVAQFWRRCGRRMKHITHSVAMAS